MVVFASNKDGHPGNFQLYLIHPDGSGLPNHTSDPTIKCQNAVVDVSCDCPPNERDPAQRCNKFFTFEVPELESL